MANTNLREYMQKINILSNIDDRDASTRIVGNTYKLPTAGKIAEARKNIDSYKPITDLNLSKSYLDSKDEGIRILGRRIIPTQTPQTQGATI